MSRSLLECVHNIFIPIRNVVNAQCRTIKSPKVYRSYYDVLNVPLNCSGKEIKRAFIELSKMYHPDGNSGRPDSDEFVKICEAYKVLYKRATVEAGQRRRYRSAQPKSWLNYQAAVRHKQFSYGSSITASDKKRPVKPSAIRLLPSGLKEEPPQSTACKDLVSVPSSTSLYDAWFSPWCVILALIIFKAFKGGKRTSREEELSASSA